jgi:lipoate---protein ligase
MILIRHHNEGALKPYFYFALEEYVMTHLLKEGQTYFFTWEIHGVVIGKNQVIENEVNLDFLNTHGIDVYRRPTGGGCVYADHRNTMFSIVTKRVSNRQFSFKDYLSLIVDSMSKIGVTIEFSGRNDLLYEGRKISGNAFLQNKHGMLMHGTFLYDCDLETMVRAITPSDEKLVSKGIDSVRSRVTNLKEYLGGMTQEELIRHFEKTLTDSVYELNEEDVKAIRLLEKKYASKDWIYKKHPPFTKVLRKRLPGGLFELRLDLEEGIIRSLTIEGDFFHTQPIEGFTAAFAGVPYEREQIRRIMAKTKITDYVLDSDDKSFSELLESGILY